MSTSDQQLIDAALEARSRAYAPYSNYQVACAILADGEIYTGVNVENASYGMALCAERSASAAAVTSGKQVFDVAVVATESSPPATPCGMCLQTLNEFARDAETFRIILVNPNGERRDFKLADLLPHGFSGESLRERTQ